MEYIVSARKYRPSNFRSVIGQTALTTTLRNAIVQKHLAHAYLFCGPRGVGKTTCARIFAKSINCFNPTEGGEACEQCPSCQLFNEQRSFNVHELDAASNNSVDDIRQLVDQVRIPPQMGKYSVYIVDEVHMLSTAAFNAFLKTLEEPPAHAIFVLATTEKHKILPTILSRCQIYDFNRITIDDTVEYLQYVAKNEGVDAETEALTIIAQKADGAMRDALSIFDQVVSFCGNKVTYQAVIENLNVLDYDYYFKMVEAFNTGQTIDTLLMFDKILNKGFDAHHFVVGLASHFRDLLMAHFPATVKLLEVGAAIQQNYLNQAKSCTPQFLYKAIDLTSKCDLEYKMSRNKRLHVELLLIKLSQINTPASNAVNSNEEETGLKQILAQQPNNQAPQATAEPMKQPMGSSPAKPNVAEHTITKQPTTLLSIKNFTAPTTQPKEEKKEDKVEQTYVKRAALHEAFDKEKLRSAFDKFIVAENVRLNIKNVLLASEIKVEGDIATIYVINPLQEKDIAVVKPSLMSFLRVALSNDYVVLNVEIDESKVKRINKSPQEIVDDMAKKEPLVAQLIEKLNLKL